MIMNLIKKILIIFLSAIFTFFAIELYFQIVERTNLWRVFPTIRPIIGEPDYEMGYKFTPNANKIWIKENKNRVIINNYGINDYEIKDSKFRVVLTGNSMIEALQVELNKNFENLTENNLQNHINTLQINNLAMSGHGPLRQLIMLENYGYPLKPQVAIMYLPISEFILDELYDDSYNPGYIFVNDSIERGYSFRNRKQIQLKDESILFNKLLYLTREVSVIRMMYFLSKKNIFDLLGIKKATKEIEQQGIDHSCPSLYMVNHRKLWIESTPIKKSIIANYFFTDLKESTKEQNIKIILFLDGLTYDKNCDEDSVIRKQVIHQIKAQIKDTNIDLIDLEFEINNLLKEKYENFDNSHRKKMLGFGNQLGTGHLNYYGHEIYSKVLTKVIKSYYDNEYEK